MIDLSFAAKLTDIPVGGVLGVTVDGVEIALVRDGEDVYAFRDECTHGAVKLSEGDVEGCEIECWLHGSRFDVRTGEALNLPATQPVSIYPTTLDDDASSVLVDLTKEK